MPHPVRFSAFTAMVLSVFCSKAFNRRVRRELPQRTRWQTLCPATLLFLLASTAGYSQTSIGDAHAAIRPQGIEMAASSPGPKLPEGSLIRTSADLVMVRVTITDALNRPIVGLDQNNFQLFENKKPQQIKNFSSEDAPISVGILVDTSHSMAKEADVLIYAVGTYYTYASTREELLGPELLKSISDVTGGQAYTLSGVTELPAVTRSIGTRLRYQYMLTFRPQDRAHDGRWRKISVKLRLPKPLVAAARERSHRILHAS